MSWQPKVDEREHPFGDQGVYLSLERVAERVSEGRKHPKVHTWSVEMLDRAREKGRSVKRPRERAVVLLEAVQKKLWVPDPVGVEYMTGPHLLACDHTKPQKEGEVCIRGGDCDCLVSLLGSSFLSVGIPTVIVGHGYDDEGHIEHVLCAAYVGGEWQYADPSTDKPLGECVPFTRERVLSVPKVDVVCDDRACISNNLGDVNPDVFVDRGVFIGVDGPPNLKGLRSRVIWSGSVHVAGVVRGLPF